MDLLRPRKHFTFDRIDAAVLATYSAVVGWTIAHHEQWFDESQAWLIARDCSLREMLTHRLRYEGAPALWHLILWVLTRLHVPFMAMNWIAALFAVGGVAVLLRYAPFPRIFRISIPFTFFFLYQYAVIARSYVLFPLFVFLLCMLYRSERPQVVRFAAVCALLTNLNVHGLIFSGGMIVLYGFELLRRRGTAVAADRGAIARGCVLYACAALFAVYVVMPPPDVNFALKDRIHKYKSQGLLAKLTGPEQLPAGAPALDPMLPVGSPPVPPMSRWQRTIWDRSHGTVGGHLQQTLLNYTIAYASLLDYPVSSSNLLALTFFVSLGLWLWSRRALVFLFPYFLLLSFEAVVWTWVHQTGLLLIGVVAAVWLAAGIPQVRGRRWFDPFFAAVSLCVIATQVGWSFFAVHYDTQSLYDPGHIAHDFLVSHYPGKRIAAFTFQTPNVQPYSSSNLFVNHEHTFWVWSSNVDINERRTEGLARHPDLILTGDEDFGDELIPNQWMTLFPKNQHFDKGMLDYWRDHGFHETHRFCGARPIRFGFANTTCDVILERNP